MSEAEVLVLGRWQAPSPERQAAAIDAAGTAWDRVGWPPGMEAYTALAGEDGTSVLHLSRWRDDRAAREFTAEHKTRWAAVVDEAVPGLVRVGVGAYRRHDGLRFAEGEPGCLVLVDIDADDPAAARRWMDAMIAVGRDETPAAGLLSATFHLEVSGTRVLNVAEWSDAAAHEAMTAAPRSDVSRGLIAGAGGAHPVGFTRCRFWRTTTATHA